MANPTPYTPQTSFAAFQANNPTGPLPAMALDTELTYIKTSIASLVSALEDVRRSDGALNNGIVTAFSLGAGLTTPIGAFPASPTFETLTLIPVAGQADQIVGPGLVVDRTGVISAAAIITSAGAAFAGFLTARGASISDTLSAGAADITGAISAASAAFTGAMAAASASITGALTAASATLTGALTAASASISGALSTASVNVSGAVSAATTSLTGALTAASATLTGALSAHNIVLAPASGSAIASPGFGVDGLGNTTAVSITSSGAISGASIALSGADICTGKQITTLTAGSTVQIGAGIPYYMVGGATSTLSSLAVTLPLNPADGQIQNIGFLVGVSVLAILGPTLVPAINPGTAAAGLSLGYIFDGPSAKWARFR
jgi:hypothetical protein